MLREQEPDKRTFEERTWWGQEGDELWMWQPREEIRRMEERKRKIRSASESEVITGGGAEWRGGVRGGDAVGGLEKSDE